MTEPLHHIIMILFGIITEGGNGLLVKASKSRLKPAAWTLRIKAGFLPTLSPSHIKMPPVSLCDE